MIEPLKRVVGVLNLNRDQDSYGVKPGRDGKILGDHSLDGNVEAHRLSVR